MAVSGTFSLRCVVFSVAHVAADVTFMIAEQTPSVMPKAPQSYPPSLKGVIWMDQAGFISNSDLLSAVDDGAVSFGDPVNPLDEETHSIFVDTVGPAWQWFNNVNGYNTWNYIKYGSGLEGGRWYRFQFNEDYTSAQIYLTYTSWQLELPKQLCSFTMTLLEPPAGLCPPPANASKDVFSQCATWVRESSIMWPFWPLKPFWQPVYYVFRIVDEHGQPIQPYFDKYVEFVKKQSKPNANAASQLQVLDARGAFDIAQAEAFVGSGSTPGQRATPTTWWIVWGTIAIMSGVLLVLCVRCAYRRMVALMNVSRTRESRTSLMQTLVPGQREA